MKKWITGGVRTTVGEPGADASGSAAEESAGMLPGVVAQHRVAGLVPKCAGH